MKVAIAPDGKQIQFIHSDAALAALGTIGNASMRRASHVEPWLSLSPAAQNNFMEDRLAANDPFTESELVALWFADMSPVGGRTLGPFQTKAAALAAEVEWIERYALCPTSNCQ